MFACRPSALALTIATALCASAPSHAGATGGLVPAPFHRSPWSAAPHLYTDVERHFGSSVSATGDVNGDGHGDLVVGAIGQPFFGMDTSYQHTNRSPGGVYVYLGGPDGLAEEPVWFEQSSDPNALFGTAATFVGDTNGDGFDDYAAGEPNFDPSLVGRVHVWLGDPVAVPSALWTITGEHTQGKFGSDIAALGDADADGYDDFAVAAQGTPLDGTPAVYWYRGSPAGPQFAGSWALPDVSVAAYSADVAPAGDANGDGYADLLVGAPVSAKAGAAFLFLGGPYGLDTTPAWFTPVEVTGGAFVVATPGDMNRDGFPEIVVGEGDQDRALLYLGGPYGPSGSPLVFEGEPASGFGFLILGAGDLDDDGYEDLLVGAPGADVDNAAGLLWFYRGAPGSPSIDAAWTLASEGPGFGFGKVVTMGDIDGDEDEDLVLGKPDDSAISLEDGRAELYLGGSDPSLEAVHSGCDELLAIAPGGPLLSLVTTLEPAESAVFFGSEVASPGDVNGDGWSDILTSTPSAFSLEDSPLLASYLFLGGPEGPSSEPAWTMDDGSTLAGGDLNGDGLGDVVVGWPGALGMDVFYGGAVGLGSVPDSSIEGINPYGGAIDARGDFNGDDVRDLVVVHPIAGSGEVEIPQILVFAGSEEGLGDEPLWSHELTGVSPVVGRGFAVSAAAAGDVDGDGYDDLVVGVPGGGVGGRLSLYLGGPTGLTDTPEWTWTVDTYALALGDSVSPAGDVNGDGFDDFLATAGSYYTGYFSAEARGAPLGAYLFMGGPSGPADGPSWTAGSEWFDCALYLDISRVAGAGDLNADGYADVAFVATAYPLPESSEGKPTLYVFLGSSAGLSATPAWSFISQYPATIDVFGFGASLAALPDDDVDGRGGLLVGDVGHYGGKIFYSGKVLVFGSPGAVAPAPGDNTPPRTEDRGCGCGFGGSRGSTAPPWAIGLASALLALGTRRCPIRGPEVTEAERN